MRAGKIATIRVNPKDCMRIVDVLEKIGINVESYHGTLSFSQATKMVLESCLIALERDGMIPNRDGFEYLEMMQGFPTEKEAQNMRAQQIHLTDLNAHPSHVAEPIPEDYDKRKRRIRYEELRTKMMAAPESFDELEEFEPLLNEFLPKPATDPKIKKKRLDWSMPIDNAK